MIRIRPRLSNIRSNDSEASNSLGSGDISLLFGAIYKFLDKREQKIVFIVMIQSKELISLIIMTSHSS